MKLLGRVGLSVTPWTIAYQATPSMGFSRQEYWSGLPCPSPGDLPNSGIKPRSPALQVGSLLADPPGKPKNTGVGSLSLLQGIFLTQESNQGLLHCRWILYHLSYQINYSLYVCVLVAQSCPLFVTPKDCSPPGSSAHGILQARVLLNQHFL